MAEESLVTSVPHRRLLPRFMEDFIVVWLDPNINETDTNYRRFIIELQHVVTSVWIVNDLDQCVDFLTDIIDEKGFLIMSDTLHHQFLSFMENIPQLRSIYVFDQHKSSDERYVKDLKKIKGIFDQINPICDALKKDIGHFNNSMMSISIISPSSATNLNELDQSFMYTQLLKDILLKMDNDDQAKRKLVEFSSRQYGGNNLTLSIIEEFDKKYPDPTPIWWYTRECFLYWMLNRAFRVQDVEVIIKMGFFARDLHRQIEDLFAQSNDRHSFRVYRGQGMFNDKFTKMSRSTGGLLSFNNFLSTSTNRNTAYMFAESATADPRLIGVLFQMEIDPSISSTPFASVDRYTYYSQSEDEILFSMHTTFRIGQIEQIGERFWEVHLTLTNDNDKQLAALTEYIRERTNASAELSRFGSLMFVMGEFHKAEEIFRTLLEITPSEDWKNLASLHHMLGYVNYEMDNQSSALTHYKKSLEVELSYLPSDDLQLCRNYTGIGLILKEQGDFDGALKHLQGSLQLYFQVPNAVQLNIATLHTNIGGVLDALGRYEEALESYKRAIEIELAELPPGHQSLSLTYTNIASTYDSLGDSETALSYYKKALEIQEKSFPPNHPWLSTTYNNMADVYDSLEDNETALVYYKKALEAQKISTLSTDPSLATVHYNVARTLEDLDRYPEAVEHAVQAVDILSRAYGPNHLEVQENQEYLDELRQKL